MLNVRKQWGLQPSFWKLLNFLLAMNRRHRVLFCRFPNEFVHFIIDTTLNKLWKKKTGSGNIVNNYSCIFFVIKCIDTVIHCRNSKFNAEEIRVNEHMLTWPHNLASSPLLTSHAPRKPWAHCLNNRRIIRVVIEECQGKLMRNFS